MLTEKGGVKPSENNSKSANSSFLTNLQALRAIAFCSVMLSHTGLAFFGGVGAWGVSVFFVLSGFVLVYSYYEKNRIAPCSIGNNLFFACSKLKRLFLLHILCTLAMMVFFFVGDKTESISFVFVTRFILNIFFLQEWVPFEIRSINGVSWFLCTILLGYFLFPWFLRLLEKNYSISKATYCVGLCLFIEFGFGLVGASLSPEIYNENEVWTYDIPHWLGYYFPLARVWDMIIGFNLGYLFIHRERVLSSVKVTSLEIVGVLFTVLSCYLFAIMTPAPLYDENAVMMSDPHRWWTYSLVFILGSIILIYTFALQNGFVSNLLSNRVTQYLAKISPYGFLIHYVVFRYLVAVYYRMPGFEEHEFLIQYGGWCQLTVGVVISLICSDIWLRLYSRFIKPLNLKSYSRT